MYRFCKHCRHTGHFVHEEGHSCKKHDFFVNINRMDTFKKMMECTDCDLTFSRVLKHARYASNRANVISFKIIDPTPEDIEKTYDLYEARLVRDYTIERRCPVKKISATIHLDDRLSDIE